MNFEQVKEHTLINLRHGHPVLLVGNPGIGKSSWAKALAKNDLHSRCFILAANQLGDKCDVTGARMTPVHAQAKNPDGTLKVDVDGEPVMETVSWKQQFFPHEVIQSAIDYAASHPAETPLLFIDEINRTSSDITSELLSLTTDRRIGTSELPDNLQIISAGNDGDENVTALDKASRSRYVIYHIEPDLNTFLQANPKLNPYIKNVLTKNPQFLYLDKEITGISAVASNGNNGQQDDDEEDEVFDMSLGDTMTQITTPRTLTALSDYLNEFSYDKLQAMLNVPDGDHSLLQTIIEAHVGPTQFTLALLNEVMTQQLNTPQQAMSLQAPSNYPLLVACTTRDQMSQMVSQMDDVEKSAMLLYACYDNRDNTQLLSILAPVTNLQPQDMATFINMAQAKTLDRANVDALYAISCPLTNICHMMNL